MPKRVPKIRFKKYTDEWKEDILSEFLEVSKEKNFLEKYDKTDVLSVSGECGIVNQIEHKGRSFAGASVANYGVVDTGDVVYTKSPLLNTPYGIIKTNKGKPGIVSTLYAVYKPKENVDPNFIECYFEQNVRINNYLKPLVNKGAKNDMKVTDENALKGLVIFPKVSEQSSISDFIKNIDYTLKETQIKIDKINTLKKVLFQKMYPIKNKQYPEIRFCGYNNVWKLQSFEKVFTEKREKTIVENEDKLVSCAIKGLYLNSELFDHFRGSSTIGYIKIKKYDLILSAQNLHLGNANVNLKFDKGIISPAYKVYEINNCNPYFIQFWVKRDNVKSFFLEAATEGASQCRKNIDWKSLNKQLLAIPEKEEQVKIGIFYKNIEKLSSLYEKKLDMIKKIKLIFLEKMFV